MAIIKFIAHKDNFNPPPNKLTSQIKTPKEVTFSNCW